MYYHIPFTVIIISFIAGWPASYNILQYQFIQERLDKFNLYRIFAVIYQSSCSSGQIQTLHMTFILSVM